MLRLLGQGGDGPVTLQPTLSTAAETPVLSDPPAWVFKVFCSSIKKGGSVVHRRVAASQCWQVLHWFAGKEDGLLHLHLK